MSGLRQSFSWWCFQGRSLDAETLLAGAARIGFAAVDLIEEPLWPLARKHGLEIAASQGQESIGLPWRRNAAAIEKEIEGNLRKAEKAGIPVLICCTGNREGLGDAEILEICAEVLAHLAPKAESAGVTLAVELLNSKVDHADYSCDHTSFGLRLCEAVASPAVRLLYDIYHMQIMEGDVIRTIQKHHAWFAHYHTGGVPGRGQPDETQELYYPAIYRAIMATGYRGAISHEFFPVGDPLDALGRAFRECASA